MTTRLPNADISLVESSKVTDYLLSLSHRDGKTKAKFFMALGFAGEDPEQLRASLRTHGLTQLVVKEITTEHGVKYVLQCEIESPDRRNPCIKSVWIVDAGNVVPRLVTAYPNQMSAGTVKADKLGAADEQRNASG